MRLRFSALLLLSSLALSGCVTVFTGQEYPMYLRGQFSQIEASVEPKVPDLRSASAQQLFLLCESYAKLRKYNQLFPCLDEADRRVASGPMVVWMADMAPFPPLRRAEALIELGNYRAAIVSATRAYERVLKSGGLQQRSYLIMTLGPLALAHALNGDRDRALSYAAKIDEIGTFYPYILLKTPKMMALAKVHMALGDCPNALEALESDSSGFWKAVGDVAVVATLTMAPGDSMFTYEELPKAFLFNHCLLEAGDVPRAKLGYETLLKRPQTRDNGEIYWATLLDRGRIAEAEGDRPGAIRFYASAVEIVERQRSTINTEASKIGFVGDKQTLYRRLIGALVAEGDAVRAFEYSERAKSRALVDLLASKKDFAAPGTAEATVASMVRELEVEEAATLVQETIDEKAGLALRSARDIINIKQRLSVAAPELAALVTVRPARAATIQSLLAPGEVLVEYYHEEDLYAFVLDRVSVTAFRLDGAKLLDDVRALREAIEDPSSRRFEGPARRLHDRLIKPLEGALSTQDLAIVPHGALHYVPFAALNDGQADLVERHSLRLLPSASILEFLRDRPKAPEGTFLAMGNPDVGDPAYDLKFAGEEAADVARDFPRATVLLRRDASKEAFLESAGRHRILHLATHGKFNADAPLSSGLLLAGRAGGQGFLSLGELYSLTLGADLVTLSACETGLGRVHNGDDVVGLTRGFLYAGSDSVVATLWRVEDRSTAELMIRFYAGLRDASRAEALRQAQLAVKRDYGHPFYWAAFQLTGRAH